MSNVYNATFSEIPDRWQVVKLKDFLTPQFRKVKKPSQNYLGLGVRSFGKGTFQKRNSDPSKIALEELYQVKKDDLIVNITFAWEGAIAIVKPEDDGALTSHRFPTYVFNELMIKDFFKYYMIQKPFFRKLRLISSGSAGRNRVLSKTKFLELQVPQPPINEQKKIASIISKVDEQISQTESIIEKTEELKKGLMQQLFTKGIDENNIIRSEKIHKFKDSALGKIPENWDSGNLIDFSKTKGKPIQTGPFGSQLHSYDYVNHGIPLILIKNISDGKIVKKDIPHIAEEKAKSLKKYCLKSGDIVFSRVGSVGRAAVIEPEQNGWLISGQLLRVRLENPQIDHFFLSYIISTRNFQKALESKTVGTTRKSINTNILSNLPLVVPPLPEQQRIASIFVSVDKNIEIEKTFREKLLQLKKGLMQDLLTGKVRVEVD
mgnify:CR=1 FL=1